MQNSFLATKAYSQALSTKKAIFSDGLFMYSYALIPAKGFSASTVPDHC